MFLLRVMKWNRPSDSKLYAEPKKEFGEEQEKCWLYQENTGCGGNGGPKGSILSITWELKLKSPGLVSFQAKSLNSTVGTMGVC